MRSVPLLLCLALAAPAVSSAAPPTVSEDTPLLTWNGTFEGPAGDTELCLSSCWSESFSVWLPETFAPTNRGIEVAVRWEYDGVTDLDLIVRRASGEELARSAALDSNAESVILPDPGNGEYTITVVPTQLFFPGEAIEPVPFEVLAQFEPGLDASDAPLVPNLISLPPHNFHLSTAANLVPFPENPLVSCYAEETLEDPDHPTRCLRFDQTIANVGNGPLEMRFEMRGVATPDASDDRIVQRIHASDGSFTDQLAGHYEFHIAHAHAHYREFGQSMLFPYDWAQQARAGDGNPARIGNKVGFCLIDVLLLDEAWAAIGNGARTRTFPTCNVPEADDTLVQGIAVGWADVYGWNLADQFIDVTDLADGIYELQQWANPSSTVVETRYDDNKASTIICLLADRVFEVGSNADAASCI